MRRVVLRGMLGRKLRTGLTAFAVVLGVAMVSGAYILTDTLLNAADGLEQAAYEGVDAVVSSREAFDVDTNNGFSEPKPIPASIVPRVRSVSQVQAAQGEIQDEAQLIGRNGATIGGEGGPTFAVGYNGFEPGAAALSPFTFDQGAFPRGPRDIAIDAGTADDEGFRLGDTIGVAARGPVRRFRITGIARFGDVQSIGNATAAIFTLDTAQRLFKKAGQVDSVLVDGRSGTDPDQLAKAITPVLPPAAQAKTAEEQDRFDLGGLKDFLKILQGGLVAFGGIALFVGAFIIFNTMSITVAQRAREFALIRMVGGSRRQILRSVILEAIVIGLIASVIGLLVGLALAAGLNAVFKSLGADLPDSGTVFKTRTVIVAFLVGVGVTVLAALAPARRATRVAPVIAFREGILGEPKRTRRHAYGAIATTVLGVALLGYGMFASGVDLVPRLLAIGGGVIVLFIGVALFSSRLVRPLASLVGRPAARIAGPSGRLARDNAMRNPSRTAVTAAALMIGIALVTFVAVLGQGLRSSYGSSFQDQVDTDYVVTADDTFSPFAPEAGQALRRNPDVTALTSIREDQVQAFGDKVGIDRIEPASIARFYDFNWDPGSDAVLARLGADGAVVSRSFADDHSLRVGSRFRALAPDGTRLSMTVRGIDKPESFDPLGLGEIFVAPALFDRTFQTERDRFVFFNTGPGATEEGLNATLRRFPDTKLFTEDAYREDQESQINEFLNLLYVLLALSVIVSLFGIVNTLVLSVFERTRELGMLRAIGMSRRQMRRMVRHESIIVALIGSVLGMAVGVFLAALVTGALSSEGVGFSLPVGTLIAFLVVAVLAGMLAAILPARRAARLNVLEALQYE
jgi:putative ABC transport system permease protein